MPQPFRDRSDRARARVGERRERESVEAADREPLSAGRAEQPPRALRERLPFEPRERLRRAETGAGAADEENPGQPWIRHGSV
jgi:hypothetical protein